MKLNYDRKSKDPTYFIQVGIRNGKKVTTKNIERIGKHSELLKSRMILLNMLNRKSRNTTKK